MQEFRDEETLLKAYERAMKERDQKLLSHLHLRCLSLKLLPLAARHDDLQTLSSLLQHRRPEKGNVFVQQALLCASPASLALLTAYVRS